MPKRFFKVVSIMLLLAIIYSYNHHSKHKFTYHKVIPVEFPKLNIRGFNFPEDSIKIKDWIHNSEYTKIQLHGQGIWIGLTAETDQFIPKDKRPLRVYETWLNPEEMIDSINGKPVLRSNRDNLKKPHQTFHFASNLETVNDSIHESVSYSPDAASFAINNKILKASTLYKRTKEENAEIPFFPPNAITIKRVFKVLAASGGKTKFNITAWNGTIDPS